MRQALWCVLVPTVACAAITAVIASVLPNRYRSETLILVVPQRVPESYVKSTVSTRIEDRLNSIIQQILSRTRLERTIQDFDLYPRERQTGIMEDVVEGMRKDITVQVVKGDAFRVAYIGDDRETVMRVAERLASLFIEENLRDREVLAEGTNQFLDAQLEDTRQRLIEKEKTLEEYRKRYAGQLPTQLEPNLQAIQNTQVQIQAMAESINRDGERRTALERQLADPESFEEPVTAAQGSDASPAQQLARARANLAAMQLRLKPEHPDVQLAMRQASDLEALVDREAALVAHEAAQNRQRRLATIRLELDLLKRQMETKQADQQQLRSVVLSYQARVEAVPTRESEMTELMRDYGTLQEMYSSLLAKKESKIAANLERRQIGEQFKILDPARIAEKPFSPNRPLINSIGTAGGFVLGLGLLAWRKQRLARSAHHPGDNEPGSPAVQQRQSFAAFIGLLAAMGGVFWALHFFVLDATALPDSEMSVYDTGLLADRQDGLLLCGIVAIMGTIMYVGTRRPNASVASMLTVPNTIVFGAFIVLTVILLAA